MKSPRCKNGNIHMFALGASRCSMCGWDRYAPAPVAPAVPEPVRPSIDHILTRWPGVLADLAKGPDGYGPHAVEVVCAALDKALTERDKWRTYCEGARESVPALTAERDQARRERDEARRELAEAVADTGDCRTCANVYTDDDGYTCCRAWESIGDWRDWLQSDFMTRLPTSPPCPGYTKK